MLYFKTELNEILRLYLSKRNMNNSLDFFYKKIGEMIFYSEFWESTAKIEEAVNLFRDLYSAFNRFVNSYYYGSSQNSVIFRDNYRRFGLYCGTSPLLWSSKNFV